MNGNSEHNLTGTTTSQQSVVSANRTKRQTIHLINCSTSLSPFLPVHQRQHILFSSVAKNIPNCRYAASETTNFNLDFLQLFDNMNIPNEYLAKTEDIADQVSAKLCVYSKVFDH